MARDWLKSLFRTSFKGVSFWIERDAESGGRRVVVHEFPMRDDPYLEDLGERYREFNLTAYLASDVADAEADRLRAACSMRGPGVLMLPTQGGVLVRCLEFERSFEKDRQGYIAFTMKCVREGFSSSLATVASLLNLVFVQAQAAAVALAETFANNILLKQTPDYVTTGVTVNMQYVLASLDVVRTGHTVDPAISATQRDAIAVQLTGLEEVIGEADPATLQATALEIIGIAQALSGGMHPSVALPAFMEMLGSVPYSFQLNTRSPWTVTVGRNKKLTNTFTRLTALIAYCEALARYEFGDRPTAVTIRAEASSRFDAELEALSSEDYELFYVIVKMRDAAIEYLSRTILDLAPVKKFDVSRSMPSIYWAWRLYADPARSDQIVARNKMPHPSFTPLRFEALSS